MLTATTASEPTRNHLASGCGAMSPSDRQPMTSHGMSSKLSPTAPSSTRIVRNVLWLVDASTSVREIFPVTVPGSLTPIEGAIPQPRIGLLSTSCSGTRSIAAESRRCLFSRLAHDQTRRTAEAAHVLPRFAAARSSDRTRVTASRGASSAQKSNRNGCDDRTPGQGEVQAGKAGPRLSPPQAAEAALAPRQTRSAIANTTPIPMKLPSTPGGQASQLRAMFPP